MQYDDTSDVSSGHDITFEGQDLGPATIDSDNDGVADSVAIADGNDVYLITDADHDGSVDGYAVIDSSGHVTDAAGTDAGLAGASSGTSTDDHQNTNVSDHTQTSGAAGDITIEADGQTYDAGAPTADFTGDGANDTAIVQGEDGTVNAFTDSDGDGQADTITQVDAEGHVTVAVSDGNGGWEVAATGHIDANGNVVEDSGSNTDPSNTTTTQQHTGTDVSNHQDTTQQHTGTDVSNHQDTTQQQGSQQQSSTGAQDDITLTANGHSTDLGAPTADLTGDGTPDTVVSQQSDGTMVGYTDSDGDGQADTVTQIAPDGSVVIGQSDGHGGWEQVATGHIDSSGNFVQDGGDTTSSSTAADSGVSNNDAGFSTSNADAGNGVAQGESSTSSATSGVAQADTSNAPVSNGTASASTASSISGAMGNASNG